MELVLFMGIQATGKSTFFRERFFDTHLRMNLDMLKTRHRESLLFAACLEAKQPSGHAETFRRGRPLNVTDLDFASDGSMILITRGYKTRSALYRVRYVGSAVTKPEPTRQEEAREVYSRELRHRRRRLESYHRPGAP